MDFRYDSYCGLYCGACDVLVANEKDEVEKAAKAWNMKPEQLRCHGCKSTINAVFCADCVIKPCAETREIEFCSQCDEYPCSRLREFRDDENPHHSIVLRNLDFIREQGVDAWLEEQRDRWSCPGCGEKCSWYDKTCRKCGAQWYNCEDEDKDLKGE